MNGKLTAKGSTRAFALVWLAGLGVAGSALVCLGNASAAAPATQPAAAEAASIEISSFKFQPASLEVKAGTKVTWKNNDAVDHTVWSGTPDKPKDGPVKTTLKGKGGTYSYTFDKPGEYPFYCDFHHKMMGKVVVK